MTRMLLQAMAGARHGGAETFFVRLAIALERAGETQRLLIRRDASRAASLRACGIAVAEARFGGGFDLRTGCVFRREIARGRPDIVLTWMSRATRACPRGRFVHVARLGGYYDLKYYRHCDHLIGNTRAIVAYMAAQGWPRERAHYLPNFVPDPDRAARGTAVERAIWTTPEAAPLALALGRLHPNKGFDLLLAALALTPGLFLWIAGDGPLRTELEALAQRLGLVPRVRFLGWRDDVPELLARADFVVSSSRHEPLGNVVIEAWAARRAVVATASDGPAALIADGESGLLVPVREDALARALARLAGDDGLRAHLAAGGRRAYEAQFTEPAVVARYRDFFDRVRA